MPLKNPKKKGADFERKVKKKLEEQGYFVVRQTSSSFPDLIALKKVEGTRKKRPFCYVFAIECKTNRKYFTKQERLKLLLLYRNFGFIPVLAYKRKREIIFETLFGRRIKENNNKLNQNKS